MNLAHAEPTQTLAALASARKERLARIEAAAVQHQAKLDEVQRQKDRATQIAAFEFAMANMPRKPTPVPIPTPTVELPAVNFRLHILTIQGAVAKHFGLTRIDIVSRRRTKDIVEPRQIAMYLAKTMATRSFPEIGRKFGWRDHTTVLHAVDKIAKHVKERTSLGKVVLQIQAELLA